MKLLFDQNLSHKLVGQLSAQFPNSTHVRDLGLAKSTDLNVWVHARENSFTIVSEDTDFQQRALLYGYPPKVIWIRLGNCSTSTVAELLKSRAADITEFATDSAASFLVLS